MVKSNEIINNIAKENSKSSKMLLDIFELNPDAISLTRVSDRKIIDCNQAYLNQIDYFRDEVIGQTSIELNLFSPKERQAYVNNIQRKKTLTDYEVKSRKRMAHLFWLNQNLEKVQHPISQYLSIPYFIHDKQ